MRISHIELATAAAQRLKVLLPSLSGLPGSVQSELFIMYSALKYLSMELERAGDASVAKARAADVLRQSIGTSMGEQSATAFHPPMATQPLADNLVDVAAILDLLAAGDPSAAAEDQVMAQLSQYLFDINQIDLGVYR